MGKVVSLNEQLLPNYEITRTPEVWQFSDPSKSSNHAATTIIYPSQLRTFNYASRDTYGRTCFSESVSHLYILWHRARI